MPKRVSQRANGDPVGYTTLKEIDLHPQLPADDFTLKPREGWSTEPHQIVED